MACWGHLWVWIAGVVVAECIGRTNWSPLSGMTLIAVTILILIAKGGLNVADTITSSMLVGAAICLAISQASDMMLDLKSGYLVGAIPRRQQLAQFIGCLAGTSDRDLPDDSAEQSVRNRLRPIARPTGQRWHR